MIRRYRLFSVLGGALLLAPLLAPAALADSVVHFQLLNNNAVMSSAHVVLFLSYGPEAGTADANGNVGIRVAKGKGMWIEVNGNRLNHFYELGQIPAVIDVAQVGFMTWHGGR